MNALTVGLMLVLAQAPEQKALQDARSKAAQAQTKLADLRTTMQKLISAVDALQQEINTESAALEAARAVIAKAEKDLAEYLVSEEARLQELRRLLSNGKAPAKAPKVDPKKDPKGLYGDDTSLETSTKATSFRAAVPKLNPRERGKVTQDGKVFSWWSFGESRDLYLYQGNSVIGMWRDGEWFATSDGQEWTRAAKAPVSLPK